MPTSRDASAALDSIWQGPTIIRVVLAGEGLAVILALAAGPPGARWIHFGLASLVIQWIALMTLGALGLLARPLSRLPASVVAYVALVVLMLATWLVCGLTWLAVSDVWPVAVGDWRQLLLRLSGIALTVGVLALAAFQGHLRNRRLAVQTKQAEVEALQARIRPHFLFNTLNTGAALIHARPDEAERLLLDLADLFRAALAGPATLPLAAELALARRYLEIESLRFGERLEVAWSLPDPLPELDVPTLSIQPLAENAIRHGIEPLVGGGRVDISIAEADGIVTIAVVNPIPATTGHHERGGHQVGLHASRARVQALTGGRGDVVTTSGDGVFTARMTLPLPGSEPAGRGTRSRRQPTTR